MDYKIRAEKVAEGIANNIIMLRFHTWDGRRMEVTREPKNDKELKKLRQEELFIRNELYGFICYFMAPTAQDAETVIHAAYVKYAEKVSTIKQVMGIKTDVHGLDPSSTVQDVMDSRDRFEYYWKKCSESAEKALSKIQKSSIII